MVAIYLNGFWLFDHWLWGDWLGLCNLEFTSIKLWHFRFSALLGQSDGVLGAESHHNYWIFFEHSWVEQVWSKLVAIIPVA